MTEPQSIIAGLTIRSFHPADRDAVVALWRRCGLIRSYNDPDRDLALWRASAHAEIFLGEQDGRVVASVCVGHDGHRGNPYYVAVDPDHRGRGIGRRMMRHAEAWLAQLGVSKMNVMVRDDNETACGFYRAIGYRDTPRFIFERWLTPDGQPPAGAAEEIGTLRCTVTYLEMTTRPATPPIRPPHRRTTALLRAHCPTVAFYRFLYNAVGEPWLWYERRAMDDDTLKAIVQDEKVEIYVLYVEGVPAGYAELDRRREREIELAYFGLMPEFIGHRLGGYLLCAAIDIAWTHAPSRLWVHSNTLDHPRALALYQRYGFTPYRQEEKVFADPRLSGLIATRL